METRIYPPYGYHKKYYDKMICCEIPLLYLWLLANECPFLVITLGQFLNWATWRSRLKTTPLKTLWASRWPDYFLNWAIYSSAATKRETEREGGRERQKSEVAAEVWFCSLWAIWKRQWLTEKFNCILKLENILPFFLQINSSFI